MSGTNITSNGLTEGDLVTYTDYDGTRRAARIDAVLGADLVGVSFPDVSRESGGGFDYVARPGASQDQTGGRLAVVAGKLLDISRPRL